MTLWIIRHVDAGIRGRWVGDDMHRPITDLGARQANGLVGLLHDAALDALMSSTYVRCVQSIEPLAAARYLPIECDDRLAEGASSDQVAGVMDEYSGREVAMCTHGDVVGLVLEIAANHGARFSGDPTAFPKGSTWKLSMSGSRVRTASYVPPP